MLSVVSGVLEAAYFATLAAAYRRGDLSVVYPIARGSAPLLAVLIGVVILGERLDPAGYVGVACLLIGILALQQPWKYLRASGREDAGAAGFALLTGVMIAGYSAVDSVAVKQTEPWIYAALIWISCVVFLWGYVWFARASARRRTALVADGGSGAAVVVAAVGDTGVEVDPSAGAVLDPPRGRRRADHARGVSPDPVRLQRRPADRRRAAPRVRDRPRVGLGRAPDARGERRPRRVPADRRGRAGPRRRGPAGAGLTDGRSRRTRRGSRPDRSRRGSSSGCGRSIRWRARPATARSRSSGRQAAST